MLVSDFQITVGNCNELRVNDVLIIESLKLFLLYANRIYDTASFLKHFMLLKLFKY